MVANESAHMENYSWKWLGEISPKVIALFQPQLSFFFFFANWGFSGPLEVFHKRLGVTSNQLKAFCANFL